MADKTHSETHKNDQTPDLSSQVEYLRELAQIVADEGLSQLEIEASDFKITLKTSAPVVYAAPLAPDGATAPVYAPQVYAPQAATPGSKPAAATEKLIPIVSPMVGVFYRAPSPSDPNFIEIGDRVERSQTIGLVEAMKVFNEITAENAGVVAEIKAQTGQLVETGEPLLLLK